VRTSLTNVSSQIADRTFEVGAKLKWRPWKNEFVAFGLSQRRGVDRTSRDELSGAIRL